jgi:hypothetical protein
VLGVSWLLAAVMGSSCWQEGDELGGGCGEADLESFDLAEPALLAGFGDAGVQVVADGGQAGPLGRVGAQQGAADAGVFVDARCLIGAAAVAQGDLAAFEVAGELGPFVLGRRAVFLGGP